MVLTQCTHIGSNRERFINLGVLSIVLYILILLLKVKFKFWMGPFRVVSLDICSELLAVNDA